MDPNETLKQIQDAIDREDFVSADKHCHDLDDWLMTGGFEPIWQRNPRGLAYYSEFLKKGAVG